MSRLALAVVCLAPLVPSAAVGSGEFPDVPYVATPEAVVMEMLDLARVAPGDVVYDLGSGDGRIVIAAARRYGARGVGIEIDPERVREAAVNAEQAGVAHRVRFVEGDLFAAEIGEATVVALYLLPEVNRRLLPKLLAELRPGTRIVSYRYGLGDWPPDKSLQASRGSLHLWVVPPAPMRRD